MMKELERYGLIECTRQGLGKPNRVVVKDVIQNTEKKHFRKGKNNNQDHENSKVNKNDNNDNSVNYTHTTQWSHAAAEVMIKENIHYDILREEVETDALNLIVKILVDTICKNSSTVRIAGENRPLSKIQERFLQLNEHHIRYVNDRFKNETAKIRSIQGYLLMRLYEARDVMDLYYQNREQHDHARGLYE